MSVDHVITTLGFFPVVTKQYQEDVTFARAVGSMADWQVKE